MMRVGSLVFATDQGLGILAKDFYDHGVVTDVLVIRHGRHPEHDEWYPKAARIGDLRDQSCIWIMEEFCKSMDVMLFFETPFRWDLINTCRDAGVKSALMPMFECEPSRLPYQPDLFLNPSELDQLYYPSGIFIPVPVTYKWTQRTCAETFVHNSGHGGLKGRNGTLELVQAMQHVKSGARLTLRAQESSRQYWAAGKFQDANARPMNLPGNIDLRVGTFPYETLFGQEDVFVFPEKFNGLSLPLQEARASGMLVMCGDRFPMNRWLPKEPLIPVQSYRKEKVGPPYNEFDEAVIDPRQIAAKIDEVYGRDISDYSRQGREWAQSMSWEVLGPRYKQALEALCG